MNLESLRKEIDKIDEEILKLLMRRYEYVKDIGTLKHNENHNIYVPEREKKLLLRLEQLSNGEIPNNTLRAIFTEIMSGGRLLEHPIIISCKKEKPFLHAYAAYMKFGKSINLLFMDSYKEAFAKTQETIFNYSMILFEDSNKGLYTPPLQDILNSELTICSEIIINNPGKSETRKTFLILGKHINSKPSNIDKTILAYSPKKNMINQSSKLLAAKSSITKRIIGTFKPSKNLPHIIFAEFNTHFEDSILVKLLSELKNYCSFFKILGSFPSED